MRRRWLAIAFALTPLLVIPSCMATSSVMIRLAREEVRQPSDDFPMLLISGAPGRRAVAVIRHAALSEYRAQHPDATLLVPMQERPAIEQLVRGLKSPFHDRDDERVFEARVDFPGDGGLIHVSLHQEIAMGTSQNESWYETDGQRIVPRYERQYYPNWLHLQAFFIAIPVSFLLAAILVPLIARFRPEISDPKWLRLGILTALYIPVIVLLLDAEIPIATAVMLFLGWLVYWIAAAGILWLTPWQTRWQAVGLLMLVSVGTGAFVISNPKDAEGAVIIAVFLAILTACILGLVWFLEKCLSAALRPGSEPSPATSPEAPAASC